MTKVNLITGFLGSGKTTLLLQLLQKKPANENWAILVNEFGEIGIDGALLRAGGATLKEIPGGCMCCVNGLPMQVGLNSLLQQHKPDRLLIEPTGLGHPKQLLKLLSSDVYADWLQLNATLTLLDPRQLADEKILSDENFRDQLTAADVIVASKADRWMAEDHTRLAQWQQQQARVRPLVTAQWGDIPLSLLDHPRDPATALPDARHHHHHPDRSGFAALKLDGPTRWRRAVNQGQGYFSCGWLFDADTEFDGEGVQAWLAELPVERVKGRLRTPQGVLTLNRQGDDVQITLQDESTTDSRIELIHREQMDWNRLQSQLLKLRLT
ncbi:CobW family GTP-binding protein [Pantoea sp. A4]|uniref:CobW family GTP-binding protein n=1 Tax=Pantoea sp. A4 TaxID=1225184 RepID=UPI00036C7364|nr:GTP-binding protein [Pantoea sp. A4]